VPSVVHITFPLLNVLDLVEEAAVETRDGLIEGILQPAEIFFFPRAPFPPIPAPSSASSLSLPLVFVAFVRAG